MALTDLEVRKLKPKSKEYYCADGNGLFLRVYSSGKKAWTLRYVFQKEQKRMTLGKYPAVSLPMVREKQALALRDVEQGIDPAEKAKKAENQRLLEPTFNDLLEEFWTLELSKSPTAAERRRLVVKDALPSWKKRKVNTITRRDAVLLLDKVRERAPITANRLQGVLVRMMNFASERGVIEFSPLAGMRRTKETARSRVLGEWKKEKSDFTEIKNFWAGMDLENTEIDIYRLTKLALKAILLTGQRPGEVTNMRWDHIRGAWWEIPAEARKNNEENRVPICPMMEAVIGQAKIYSSDSEYVFRSTHTEGRPITVRALTRAIARHSKEIGIEEAFTSHDLRRTVRTGLAAVGVSDIVAEKVLGHKLQGLLAVYNQYPYDEEKQQALMAWERWLHEILELSESSQNVIPFEVHHG